MCSEQNIVLLGTQLPSQSSKGRLNKGPRDWPLGACTVKYTDFCMSFAVCLQTYLCMYVFSGESFNSSHHNFQGVLWSPNSKRLHWLHSAVLFISRILSFCGYDAFKIGLGSQWKHCLRVFPQWEQCHNWFPLFRTNKWNFIFRVRKPTHGSDESAVRQSGGTPVAGNTGSPAGGGAQEEREIPQRKPEVLVK